MQYFTADARDGASSFTGCSSCCCQLASGMPGETNKWAINYAPWSVPLGGRGLTVNSVYEVEKRADPAFPVDPSPFVHFALSAADEDYPELTGSVIPAGVTYAANTVFKLLPIFEPEHGEVTINASTGAFVFTAASMYFGYDRFFYTVTEPGKSPVVGEVAITVQQAGAPPEREEATPAVLIRKDLAVINGDYHTVTFPIEFSPAVVPGDIYRLTVRQQAMDCDAFYWHIMCFDIKIGKCG